MTKTPKKEDARKTRLKDNLRANLQKRKTQARARSTQPVNQSSDKMLDTAKPKT